MVYHALYTFDTVTTIKRNDFFHTDFAPCTINLTFCGPKFGFQIICLFQHNTMTEQNSHAQIPLQMQVFTDEILFSIDLYSSFTFLKNKSKFVIS